MPQFYYVFILVLFPTLFSTSLGSSNLVIRNIFEKNECQGTQITDFIVPQKCYQYNQNYYVKFTYLESLHQIFFYYQCSDYRCSQNCQTLVFPENQCYDHGTLRMSYGPLVKQSSETYVFEYINDPTCYIAGDIFSVHTSPFTKCYSVSPTPKEKKKSTLLPSEIDPWDILLSPHAFRTSYTNNETFAQGKRRGHSEGMGVGSWRYICSGPENLRKYVYNATDCTQFVGELDNPHDCERIEPGNQFRLPSCRNYLP